MMFVRSVFEVRVTNLPEQEGDQVPGREVQTRHGGLLGGAREADDEDPGGEEHGHKSTTAHGFPHIRDSQERYSSSG